MARSKHAVAAITFAMVLAALAAAPVAALPYGAAALPAAQAATAPLAVPPAPSPPARIALEVNDIQRRAAKPNLCTANGIKTGSVTKKVCASTPDVCEVYIKKGNENGVSNIKTCRQYCNAYDMDCTAQYEDKKNGCVRDYKYGSCDDKDDTSDHICQCGKASTTPASGCVEMLGALGRLGLGGSCGASATVDKGSLSLKLTDAEAGELITYLASSSTPLACVTTPSSTVTTTATTTTTTTTTSTTTSTTTTTTTDAPTPTGGDLCTTNGVKTGSVTKKVCTNTPDVCEVYIKKGNENSVSNIKTCRQYCNAYDMDCAAQYEDKRNGCGRKYKYGSCDDKGGKTSDHICQCSKAATTTTTVTTTTTTAKPTTTPTTTTTTAKPTATPCVPCGKIACGCPRCIFGSCIPLQD